MNIRLRHCLAVLALGAGLLGLGLALGEPVRPGALVSGIGQDAVSALAAAEQANVTAEASPERRPLTPSLGMPFFSFGKRASAGAP